MKDQSKTQRSRTLRERQHSAAGFFAPSLRCAVQSVETAKRSLLLQRYSLEMHKRLCDGSWWETKVQGYLCVGYCVWDTLVYRAYN